MINEFKEFALRGSVVDMAIGIIIGAAFGAIISTLVDGVLMPPLGLLLGGLDFTNMFWVLKPSGATYPTLEAAKEAGAVTMDIGLLINSVVKFTLIAFALFLIIKVVNKAKAEQEEDASEPSGPSQEDLLAEIRDLLKK